MLSPFKSKCRFATISTQKPLKYHKSLLVSLKVQVVTDDPLSTCALRTPLTNCREPQAQGQCQQIPAPTGASSEHQNPGKTANALFKSSGPHLFNGLD